jgi:glutamyl-tRNA reductase
VEEATNELNRWQHVRVVATAFATLRQQADIWQEAELARALARLGHLDERDRELVRQFGCCLVEKMVDQAINWMCQLAEPGPPDAVCQRDQFSSVRNQRVRCLYGCAPRTQRIHCLNEYRPLMR